ncbi:prephenate dehydratase [Planomonospora parontospora subsp. parontospora]|uniref:Prephenate dehydratase n=2 Tax=Planomonospora parontospora TaxID=58119 RepID=A0AA37BFB4_9ACTN|nr:prephenate dehydratase [Planomonospora parontospora]GGK61744.1 prephenate dehydratase [Planomonospora parontospora]GII08626.1 prephenate dehydratase [Planomonospora parontospora subsp. parontospora]
MLKLAYLGPEGTFAEEALRILAPEAERLPSANVGAALDAARRGEADGAVVPLENSIEGGIATTLDELARSEPLLITAELLLPVEFSLLARPGKEIGDIKRVISHPAALTQCRGYIARELPDAVAVSAPSTAGAAQEVALPGSPYDAAIAARIAGEHYGLVELAGGIGDRSDTVTRFVRLSRPAPPPAPTGSDRTSLVAFLSDDHPGALLEMLTEFSVRGVNLTRIESRPTGDGIGRYFFHFDFEGHIADARVGEAVSGLHRVCEGVRFLGSYPRADGLAPQIRRGTADADFDEASGWLARIRGGQV